VRICGSVITRQRPGTAKGFCFITLEDETGFANAIVRPRLFEESRLVINLEPALVITGRLQNEQGVIHVMAEEIAGMPDLGLPAQASHDYHYSSPEEQGVSSSAILGFVEAAEKNIDVLHSFMLVRHGRVVAEGWWSPYAADIPHSLFSLSKSFTSTAVGLAVDEGRLSLDDRVIQFFPDEAPAAPGKNLQEMRVRDLLRMSSGQAEADIKAFSFRSKQDLVREFLAMPVPFKPGTHFVYNTEATYMLSAIVQKATGRTVLDYLGPRLFEPLGIANPTWQASAQGIPFGGFGLSVRTEDIARFGQLYLQRGLWRGRQLLPAAWVDAATSLQTSNGSDPTSDWSQGYGYQFWRCRHGFYRGDGAFGQFCIVMPQYDAVVAITSGTNDMQGVMNLIWDRIVPALKDGPLPADPDSDRRLAERLAGLRLKPQEGKAGSPAAAAVAGKRYAFAQNPMGLESFAWAPAKDGEGAVLSVRMRGIDQKIPVGKGNWVKGSLTTATGTSVAVASSGAWTADDTYAAVVCRYRTPFLASYRIRFSGDEADLVAKMNVGSEGKPDVHLVGKAAP
jgi:CubicO group peptidase (beta-lactamase class C family)